MVFNRYDESIPQWGEDETLAGESTTQEQLSTYSKEGESYD